MQAGKGALCVIRHVRYYLKWNYLIGRLSRTFCEKMQLVYRVACMSLMTDFAALRLSFVGNEASILTVPEVYKLY